MRADCEGKKCRQRAYQVCTARMSGKSPAWGGGGKKAKKPGAERGLPQNLLGRGRCLEWTGNGETG